MHQYHFDEPKKWLPRFTKSLFSAAWWLILCASLYFAVHFLQQSLLKIGCQANTDCYLPPAVDVQMAMMALYALMFLTWPVAIFKLLKSMAVFLILRR